MGVRDDVEGVVCGCSGGLVNRNLAEWNEAGCGWDQGGWGEWWWLGWLGW